MPRQDTVDFLAAFAVGTVLGVGATLLLQPEPTRRERVVKKLKPYRKQMRRSYENMARGVKDGSGATAEMTTEVIGAGRELLGDFREEVADILEQARDELQELVQSQVKEVGRAAKKTRRRVSR